MARILRAPLARTDLIHIWRYIAEERSEAVADGLLERIYEALETLAQTPAIGRERPEYSGTPRSFVVRPYVIFYEPLRQGEGIAVWRVLHGARMLENVVRRPGRVE
jgi:plasmid stabilization system protein ParE